MGSALVENLAVAGRLEHGHVVLLLVLPYLAADTHTLGEQFHELVVKFINLLAQRSDALGGVGLAANNQQRKYIVEHIWCDLLLCVAPSLVGVAVALDEKAIETEVQRLLAERGYELAAATYVARVAYHGQVGYATVQLDRYLPHGQVAVNLLVVAGESAVNGGHALDAGLVDALHCAYPQLEVGVDRILDEHRYVDSPECVGHGLHGKWVGRSARADPQYVYPILQGQLYMFGRGHLSGHQHASFLLHTVEPWQRRLAVSLKSSGLGARLPHTGAEHPATFHGELLGGFNHLFFCLR